MLRIMCVVALTLVAFAHRPVALPETSGFDLAAYTLPDGSVPVLCITDDGDGSSGHAGSGSCEFCRIATSIVLPAPSGDFVACGEKLKLVFAVPRETVLPARTLTRSQPARGPPAGNQFS